MFTFRGNFTKQIWVWKGGFQLWCRFWASLLGLYFDAAVVFVKTSSLLFRLALAILCKYARKSTLEITSSTLQRRRKVDILEEQKYSKGQKISKGLFGLLKFSQKRMNEFVTVVKTNLFVRFLGEFEETKKSFRNYPSFRMAAGYNYTKCLSFILSFYVAWLDMVRIL